MNSELHKILQELFPEKIKDQSSSTLEVNQDELLTTCQTLFSNPKVYCDMLSCLSGIDNGPEAGTMEVIYNLYSIPYNWSLMVKVILDRTNPEIPSIASVWKTADWHEREAYDLLGIRFTDHPDLRRILLPADWEGHPLRKDYEHQEKYRGIQVKY